MDKAFVSHPYESKKCCQSSILTTSVSSGLCQDLQVERCQFLVHQAVSGEDPPVRCLVWLLYFVGLCAPSHPLLPPDTVLMFILLPSGPYSSLSRSLRRPLMVPAFPRWWNREAAPAWTPWIPVLRKHLPTGSSWH